jgi:hypothetical protein
MKLYIYRSSEMEDIDCENPELTWIENRKAPNRRLQYKTILYRIMLV